LASVFISYASEDQALGEEVCRLLEGDGITCWIAPRNVEIGRDYGEQILDGIESTRVMVLILSHNANRSTFVKNEVERAVAKDKVVIPFRIEDVQPSRSLELFVSRTQRIDAWTPPLDPHVHALAGAIRSLVGLPPRHRESEAKPQVEKEFDQATATAEQPGMDTCVACGRLKTATKWTCPHCGNTEWGVIAFTAILGALCLAGAYWGTTWIGEPTVRAIAFWTCAILGVVVLSIAASETVIGLKTPKASR
jgi:hypothetical protein